MSTYLIHHGIKGMKWGVRHGPPYPIENKKVTRSYSKSSDKKHHLTDKQKRIIKIGAAVALSGIAAYGAYKLYQTYGPRPNYVGIRDFGLNIPLADTIKDYSDKSITLKPGTKLQRISRYKNPDYALLGHTYVSYLFNDNVHYKTGLNQEMIWRSPSTYVHNIKTKEAIKVPSTKYVASVYHELFPSAQDQNFRTTMMLGFLNRPTKGDLVAEVSRDRAKALKKELLNRGYNAIIDIEDAPGRTAPLIILDTSIFGSDSVHKLGKLETLFAKIMR